MQLRVLVLGNHNLNRRVSESLANSNVEAVYKTEVSDALNLLKQEKFDLALVDGYRSNIEAVCYRITWLYLTPVALVIKGKQTDWSLLRNLDVDGFVPEEAGDMELAAYFQTIARRRSTPPPKIKALIIEDDEHNRETLKLSFGIYWPEAEVETAALGQDGIRRARQNKPDVILLDLMLPDISGFEVLDEIRTFSQAPVIILTADRDPDNMIRAFTSGANDLLLKPFKQIELMSRIRQHVGPGVVVS